MPAIEPTAPTGSNRPGAALADLAEQPQAGDQRDAGERQVDQEHRAPGEVLEQQPAADRAERDGEAGDRRPDADRRGPLRAGREGR